MNSVEMRCIHLNEYISADIATGGMELRKMIKDKIIYWLKNIIQNQRSCRRFCVTCEYFDICRMEENESKNTSEGNN